MRDTDDLAREERGIYVVGAMTGAPVVAAVLIEGGAFDTGATIGLALIAGAVLGLRSLARRVPSLPRARVSARSSPSFMIARWASRARCP